MTGKWRLVDVHVRGRGRVGGRETSVFIWGFCSTQSRAVAVFTSSQCSFCFCSLFSLKWTKTTAIKSQSTVMRCWRLLTWYNHRGKYSIMKVIYPKKNHVNLISTVATGTVCTTQQGFFRFELLEVSLKGHFVLSQDGHSGYYLKLSDYINSYLRTQWLSLTVYSLGFSVTKQYQACIKLSTVFPCTPRWGDGGPLYLWILETGPSITLSQCCRAGASGSIPHPLAVTKDLVFIPNWPRILKVSQKTPQKFTEP